MRTRSGEIKYNRDYAKLLRQTIRHARDIVFGYGPMAGLALVAYYNGIAAIESAYGGAVAGELAAYVTLRLLPHYREMKANRDRPHERKVIPFSRPGL